MTGCLLRCDVSDLHSKYLAQQHGLTGPQTIILTEAARLGHPAIGDLARLIDLSPVTVTDIVKGLERRGLISPSPQ